MKHDFSIFIKKIPAKILPSLAGAALLLCLLAGCGTNAASPSGAGAKDSAAEEAERKTLRIVTTTFPVYDWVRSILGTGDEGAAPADIDFAVSFLADSGADLHSFQPTATDILSISSADLFVYVGGESDAWVGDALRDAVNQDRIVVRLFDALGDRVREEELTEGMERELEDDEEKDAEEIEYDEHVWLSLRNAAVCCDAIADALAALDPVNADVYRKNTDTYKARLTALDADYRAAVERTAHDTLLFGDRFPFRYLVDDYGLSYYAAFAGCSAETEASFETVVFLANKVDELALPAILVIDGSDQRIAETIRDNTASKDQTILTLDSMQSTTAQDAAAGATWLSIMEQNLAVLRDALA